MTKKNPYPNKIKIILENVETFAKLNFLKDLVNDLYEVYPRTWEHLPQNVKDIYVEETKVAKDEYILTEHDLDRMLSFVKV